MDKVENKTKTKAKQRKEIYWDKMPPFHNKNLAKRKEEGDGDDDDEEEGDPVHL